MTETEPQPGDTRYSAVHWAREHGERFTWSAAADNYEPTRHYFYGEGWHYVNHHGGRAIILEGTSDRFFRDGGTERLDRDAFYLIDDGRTIRAYYVAFFHPDHDYVGLHEMPRNFDDDGEPIMRPDGRQVDHSVGFFGPRKAYHVKTHAVSRTETRGEQP